jgi:hypothetical protein
MKEERVSPLKKSLTTLITPRVKKINVDLGNMEEQYIEFEAKKDEYSH